MFDFAPGFIPSRLPYKYTSIFWIYQVFWKLFSKNNKKAPTAKTIKATG
jgi:hypothetical protein